MSQINQQVVKALRLTYTTEQLEAARAIAAADLLSGVQITNITFEGGGASGRPLAMEPGYLIDHIQTALDQLDDPDLAARASSSSIDLSRRQWGT